YSPLRISQQIATPLDGLGERLLARRRRSAPARENGEAVTQSPEHLQRAPEVATRRRQFDRQRNAVQMTADLHHRIRIVLVERKCWLRRPGPVYEQRDCLEVLDGVPGYRPTRVGQRQWRYAPHAFGSDAQHLPTGRDYSQGRSGRQERLSERRA